MICPACTSEVPSNKDRKKTADCSECYVLTDTWDEKARKRLCDCHAVDHKKENLKGYKPLDDSILKLIEVERAIEKNQKAKDYYQEKINKEVQEQLDYANERPRVVLDE